MCVIEKYGNCYEILCLVLNKSTLDMDIETAKERWHEREHGEKTGNIPFASAPNTPEKFLEIYRMESISFWYSDILKNLGIDTEDYKKLEAHAAELHDNGEVESPW
ncbi:MAG: hypothetical protein FWG63_03910 [Defluviitaleaceae bacterium]|nr:hypothetical protein [Defluviitaleaceae bacterium]